VNRAQAIEQLGLASTASDQEIKDAIARRKRGDEEPEGPVVREPKTVMGAPPEIDFMKKDAELAIKRPNGEIFRFRRPRRYRGW
jgi:hypothetical protein